MKKILYSLSLLLGLSLASYAQSTTLRGTVLDSVQQPVEGMAVFFYESTSNYGGNINTIQTLEYGPSQLFTYTNANGEYTFTWPWNSFGDTLVVGVLDCQENLILDTEPYSIGDSIGTVNFQVPCIPDTCKILIEESHNTIPGYWSYYAVALFQPSHGNHLWDYDNNIRTRPVVSNPQWAIWYPDTMTVLSPTAPHKVCYSHSACPPTCLDTARCSAHFFVDQTNSINFQGQVILWENSITRGTTNYFWDFGDGNTSNAQYPTHTYADTGVYLVCLTITSVLGTDTCTDTFCDSVGFDANGNLVYKTGQQGFTINVIDPKTVGLEETTLENSFSLYPNPSNGSVNLHWEEHIEVTKVELMHINGQLVQSEQVEQASNLQLEGLQNGLYVLRIMSDQGVTSLRLMVE